MKHWMKRKIPIILTLLLFFGAFGPATVVSEAAGGVRTMIPTFKVTLNGTVIQNDYSQYPLIVYKDITYFPMTYFDCRFLSVETNWLGSQKGLFIDKSEVRGAYTPYTQANKNNRTNTAALVTFPVTINGKTINNNKEPYPLLNFRNVTYFPMTWRFCVDELGWEYSYDSKNGLVIQSSNRAVTTYSELPEKKGTQGFRDQVTFDGDNAYYMDTKGRIIRMPMSKLSGRKASPGDGAVMYQVPDNSYSQSVCVPVFYERNGRQYLWFNTGGGVMGSRYRVEMSPEAFTVKQAGQSEYFDFGDGNVFEFWTGGAPDAANLTWKRGAGDEKKIGDPKYIYGWDWTADEYSNGGSGTDSLYYDGGHFVYTLAFDMTGRWENNSEYFSHRNGVVRIDLRDNQTELLSPKECRVSGFEEENGILYYSAGESIYMIDTKTGVQEVYSQSGREFDELSVLGGVVYGVCGKDETKEVSDAVLYRVGRDGSISPVRDVQRWTAMAVKTDKAGGAKYLVITCKDGAGAPYHLVVLDESGRTVLKNSDVVIADNTAVKNGRIYYFNHTTNRPCSAEL